LRRSFATNLWKTPSAPRFVELGYVLLIVDSFSTRGIRMSCTGDTPAIDRVLDAYGGLAFLAGLPFVDPERVALVRRFRKGR